MTSLFTYFKSPPPFEVWHSHPGTQSKVLITAGVDGDEYAGIEAAKMLIKTYRGATPITIIPIVNLPGYYAKMSLNPLDGRNPKYIYPGSPYGSSTSRLMHQVSHYAKNVQLWIDLHGGASDEHLKPFIWISEPYPVISYVKGRTLLDTTFHKKITYIMLESGELGQIKQSAINQHLNWVSDILNNLGKPAKPNWQPNYTKVKFAKNDDKQKVSSNSLWYSTREHVTAS